MVIPDRGSTRPESPRGSPQGRTSATFQKQYGSGGSRRGWHGVSNRCQTNGTEAFRPKRTLDGEIARIAYHPGELGTWQHRRLHLITRRSQVQILPPLRKSPWHSYMCRGFSRVRSQPSWPMSNLCQSRRTGTGTWQSLSISSANRRVVSRCCPGSTWAYCS